jgi:hypothetical protein
MIHFLKTHLCICLFIKGTANDNAVRFTACVHYFLQAQTSKAKPIIKEVNVKFLEVPGMYMEQWHAFLASGVIWATGSMSLHPIMAKEKFGLGVGGALAYIVLYRISL